MKPELKTQVDQDALWTAISDGRCRESDHAPHAGRKQTENAVYARLETTLPLLAQLCAMAA
jgi:dihydroorotase-like cyclic amidohydrolase